MFVSPPYVYLIGLFNSKIVLAKLYSSRMFLPVITILIFFISSIESLIWGNETEDFHGNAIDLNLLQGIVHGVEDQNAGMKVFQGIPYAKPPTGDLRWRPTVPLESFDDLGKGDDFQHLTICPQDKEGVERTL